MSLVMTWPTFKEGDKILLFGLLSRKHLINSLPNYSSSTTIISYGDLLCQSNDFNFYESPRQVLSRILETALIRKHLIIIFENFNEFLEEPGLWFHLKDFWFERLAKGVTIIASVPPTTNSKVNLVLDHFETILSVSDVFKNKNNENFSLIDREIGEKEGSMLGIELDRVIEEMINDGRTCAQLMNNNPNSFIKHSIQTGTNNSISDDDLSLDKVYGIDKNIKDALLHGAKFTLKTLGPRGILLHGPPGTGKTRLVLALSRTLGNTTRFISVAASDLLRAEIGVSELKLKEIFDSAKSSQPAVIFFDEIDAIFPENPPLHLLTLQHQLIAELDAIERDQIISNSHCKVFLIGATNFIGKVSKRILGVERFRLKLEIKIPNDENRWELLVNELERENVSQDFLKKLHLFTKGKSPAEIKKIIQDAYKNSWIRLKDTQSKAPCCLIDNDFGIV